MTTYIMNPRKRKRWFREDELVYDLIKQTVKNEWIDPSCGNGGGNFIQVEREQVLLTSSNLAEIKNLKEQLES